MFDFILLGRRVTVALGPKGNNLSLGGKTSQVSAEDAYTVRISYREVVDIGLKLMSLAPDYSRVWQGCRVRLP